MMPLPLMLRSPKGQKESGMAASWAAASVTWIAMGKLVLSIRDAVLIVSPAPASFASGPMVWQAVIFAVNAKGLVQLTSDCFLYRANHTAAGLAQKQIATHLCGFSNRARRGSTPLALSSNSTMCRREICVRSMCRLSSHCTDGAMGTLL